MEENREELINKINDVRISLIRVNSILENSSETLDDLRILVDKLTVGEVVHCYECKNYNELKNNGVTYKECKRTKELVSRMSFCSWAEKVEGIDDAD